MLGLKKLDLLPFLKLKASVWCIIGLVAGILYSLGGLIFDTLVSMEWMSSSETTGLSLGTLLAFGAILGMPILFSAIGIITGLIEAIILNLFPKMINRLNNSSCELFLIE